MRTIVRGKNLEVPDRVRQYAERKFARLDRLFDDNTDAVVELSNEAHRSASDAHIADVTLVIDGRTLRSRAAGGSYQAALDTVVDKVERQAIDHKEKPRVRARPEQEKAILRKIADGTAEPGHDREIVKTKRFAIEPMFEEDAVAAMEELGHDFYVFVNAENERVSRPVSAAGRRLRADRAHDGRRVHARPTGRRQGREQVGVEGRDEGGSSPGLIATARARPTSDPGRRAGTGPRRASRSRRRPGSAAARPRPG